MEKGGGLTPFHLQVFQRLLRVQKMPLGRPTTEIAR